MECDDIAVGGCEVEDASMWMVRVTGSGQVWRSVEEGLFPLSRWALMADTQLLTGAVRLTDSEGAIWTSRSSSPHTWIRWTE